MAKRLESTRELLQHRHPRLDLALVTVNHLEHHPAACVAAALPPKPGYLRDTQQGYALRNRNHTNSVKGTRVQATRDKPAAYGSDLARRKPQLKSR